MKSIQLLISIFILIVLQACGGPSDKQLISAAYNGKTKTLEQAIIDGKDVNTTSTKQGIPLLSYAAGAGHTPTVSMLLMHQAEINRTDNNGWTALHFAASNGHLETLDLLTAMGADLNLKTSEDWTALMYAVFANHTEVVKRLIFRGADKSFATADGLTAAEIAKSKGFHDLLAFL